jgi:hypothetical protein
MGLLLGAEINSLRAVRMGLDLNRDARPGRLSKPDR